MARPGIELSIAAMVPAFTAARNAARLFDVADACWIEQEVSTRATGGATPAVTAIGNAERSVWTNRTCGAPQLGQNAELSLTEEWH